MLFATLDPTARALELPDGRCVMLVDTVGLVSRLPHNLVEAFKSTLEEAINADLILNVCDISSDEAEEQVKITKTLIDELGGSSIPMLNVANKCDRLLDKGVVMGKDTVFISAQSGYGIDKLLSAMCEKLKSTVRRIQILVPYIDAGILSQVRVNGKVFSEEYREDGIFADVLVDIKDIDRIKIYMA